MNIPALFAIVIAGLVIHGWDEIKPHILAFEQFCLDAGWNGVLLFGVVCGIVTLLSCISLGL